MFDNLTPTDFSESARHQDLIPGYTAAIRKIEPTDLIDMLRMQTIDTDSAVKRWMPSNHDMTEEELVEFSQSNENLYIWAVSGISETVGKDQIGELQGWVTIRKMGEEQINNLIKAKLIDTRENIWEISYAALPGIVKKGQISSGLAQSITAFISETYGQESDTSVPIVIPTLIGFTDPENVPSEKVLARSFFENCGQAYYDEEEKSKGKINNVWILNYEKLNNKHEVQNLEAVNQIAINKQKNK